MAVRPVPINRSCRHHQRHLFCRFTWFGRSRCIYPLAHSLHVHFVLFFLVFCLLYVVCPYCKHFSKLSLSDNSKLSLQPPPYISHALNSTLWHLPNFSQFFTDLPKRHSIKHICLRILLLLSGNVELNPGPSYLSLACLNSRSVSSTNKCDKSSLIQELIVDNSFDILNLTETWINPDLSDLALKSITPPGFSSLSCPRASGRGGGIACIYRSFLKVTSLVIPTYESFEVLGVQLSIASQCFNLFTAYRPPSCSMSTFLSEFSSFLSSYVSSPCEFLISGDFNIHVDDNGDPYGQRFLDLLDSFALTQHVSFPTHIKGHTLDLLISRSASQLVTNVSCTDPLLSDHYCIYSSLLIPSFTRPPKSTKYIRSFSTFDPNMFCQDLRSSKLFSAIPSCSLFDYFQLFKSTITDLLNVHAPLKVVSVPTRPSKPFITPEIRREKAIRSHLESRYRKTKSLSDLTTYKQQARLVKKLITSSRRNYFRHLIANSKDNPRKLWSSLNSLLLRTKTFSLPVHSCPSTLASSFLSFFKDKISLLNSRPRADNISPHSSSPDFVPTLSKFEPTNETEVKAAILSSSDSSCVLDFLPTRVLKQCLDTLLPIITKLVNLCITESTFPSEFKHAIITPRLKKESLPTDDLANYRPISNLNFISKILERILYIRLRSHLESFSAVSPFQSAYRKFHSVETALLRIQNDLLTSAEKKQVSALVLLDLSSAFDTVDHNILLYRLSLNFGITGSALALLTSYLTNRTQSVMVDSHVSPLSLLSCGVPQGSVLGPLLFTLYTTPLSYLLSDSKLSFHFYADDTQLYISFSANACQEALLILSKTLDDVHNWLSRNRLYLNPSKTEFLLIGTNQQRAKVSCNSFSFAGHVISATQSARNLGVIFEQDLCFSSHIKSVSRSSFYYIKQLRQIRPLLDHNSAVTLANSLVSSRLDFCNSLYFELPKSNLHQLQLVQNALARAVFPGSRKRDHVSPLLRRLHWLPIEQRIQFKVATLTFKTLQFKSPSYLSVLLVPKANTRNLRSHNKCLLTVPRVNSALGRRSFSFSAPTLWNSLMEHDDLRECFVSGNLGSFRSKLKSHLFPP